MDTQSAEAFLADPCAWGDPGRVAAVLAPGLQGRVVHRLISSPRTAGRASALLSRRLGQGSLEALEPVDRKLALASAASLRMVAAAAGAVWHAARVRSLLRANEITALAAMHGPGVRAAALRHGALSPAPNLAGPDLAATEDLGNAIARDGARCLAAWIDTLPAWAGGRIRLKWPDDTAPLDGTGLRTQAVAIVRAIAGDESDR